MLSNLIQAITTLVHLFRGRTPEPGRHIVKSGVASLTIAGMISTGRLSAGDLDSTLLLVLSIAEVIAYAFGVTAIGAGASQCEPDESARILGVDRESSAAYHQQASKKLQSKIKDRLRPIARDLSDFNNPNPTNKKEQ